MRDVGKVGASVSKDVDGLIGTLGKVGLAGVGVHVITEGLGKLKDAFAGPIAAASDMAETQSKAAIVFGQSSDVVQQFAADAVSGLGLTKQATIEAAATFGNLLLSTGTTRAESAKMSTTLVQLSADLASFNNVSGGSAQVLEDLRSGIVGEAEPLRKYGILLTEAAVAQEAVRLKLAASTDAVSEQAKVQARYSLILQQTTTAQGDFARTSDGLANSTRIVQAAFGDFAGQLGGLFLPAIQPVMAALGKELPRILPALVEALRPVGDAFASVGRQVADFITSGGLQQWVQNLKGQIDFALQALGILAQGFGSAFDSILRIVLSVGTLILEAFGLINPFVRHSPSLVESVEMGFARIGETIGDLPGQVVPAIQAAGAAMASLGEAARGGLAQAAAIARAEMEKLIALLGPGVLAAYQQAQAALAGYEAAMAAVKEQITAAQADLDGLNRALKDQERALADNEKALKRAQDAYAETGRTVSDLQGQIEDANRAIAGLGSTALPGENEQSQKVFGLENAINLLKLQRADLLRSGVSEKDPRIKAIDAQIEANKKELEYQRLVQHARYDGARNEIEQARKAADYRETEKNTILQGIQDQIAKRKELQVALDAATQAQADAKTKVDEAAAATELQKQKVEAARDAVEQQRDKINELQDIYSKLNTQAGTWRDQMQETERAATSIKQSLEAAERAAKGAAGVSLPKPVGLDLPKLPGAGAGADTGPGAANQLVGPGALAAPMTELEKRLSELRILRDKIVGGLKDTADGLSGIAGTGKSAAEALERLNLAFTALVDGGFFELNFNTDIENFKQIKKAWDEYVQPIIDQLKPPKKDDKNPIPVQKDPPLTPGPILQAIIDIGNGLVWLGKQFDLWLKYDLPTWWNGVTQAFKVGWANVSATVTTAWKGITDFFSTEWTSFTTNANTLWTNVVKGAEDGWNDYTTKGKTFWGGVLTTVTETWASIATGVSNGWNGITGFLTTNFATFLNGWNKFWQVDVYNAISQAFADGQTAAQGLIDFFNGVFKTGFEALTKPDGVLGRLKSWWDGLLEVFRQLTNIWDALLGKKKPEVPSIPTGATMRADSAPAVGVQNVNITMDARGVDADRLARALPGTLATLTRTRGLSGAL